MNQFELALKKYLDIFSGQEMYFINDNRNLELFKKNPSNSSVDDVRNKMSAMNDAEINQHTLMEEVIKHIINLKIDDRINRGDLTVVEDIANISAKGKSFSLLHFASAFCNFHKPDLFPIYSDQHIGFYKRYIKEYNLPLDPEKINTYDVFSKALKDLVHRLGLTGKMNYLQIRKFGWLYAETVVKEANA